MILTDVKISVTLSTFLLMGNVVFIKKKKKVK